MKEKRGIYSPLYTDLYELTMAQGYFLEGKWSRPANFDYFFRKMPFKGGYVVFAGLKDLLDVIYNYRFETEELVYLEKIGFKKPFLDYLKDFKFKGTIYAPQEGEIIFSNEPVLRMQGNLLETQILETVALNILNFQSLIATKASRMRHAAGDRMLIDFGLRRAQGEGGVMASRAAIIGGANSTSNVYSAFNNNLDVSGTMAHSWIESFDSELEAFRKFADLYPDNSVLLVDTYDTVYSGIPNAIQVAREMRENGQQLVGVRLDSGDLAYMSKKSRKMLDEAGFPEVKIVVSNQLDEYLIQSLLNQGAPIDGFGVGTNLIIGRDDAALDGVYKLSEFDGQPRLKISDNPEKILLPGQKKIYRYYDGEGAFSFDGLLLDEETDAEVYYFQNHPMGPMQRVRKEELLMPVMQNGELKVETLSPQDISAYRQNRLELLRDEYKRFENPHIYRVGISKNLYDLRGSMVEKYRKNLEKNESAINR